MSDLITALAEELYAAREAVAAIRPITDRHPELTIDDAYRIQLATVERRCAEGGQRIVGRKIGVTSEPVMDLFGVREPDFGVVTSGMMIDCAGEIETATLIAPKVEGEIAFILGRDLTGPDITEQDVLDATALVMPCLEIVDSRISDWKIKIQDTVADNASAALVVLGDMALPVSCIDLVTCGMSLEINGELRSTGAGAASLGHPARAVAWLANTLGRYGTPLRAGEVILSGSLGAMLPVAQGDHVRMTLSGLGTAEARFL
ncbi:MULTISPECIES: fumarylacetoacetate hydrolase family protein [unclassified Sphingomonas]|uniref:fumarylacetoacetate hydrolase family protein n=1 Tax=unclassified Sphingomonas TaxID=196159 RepID=UPI0006F8C8CA|nr:MULTISPECIES: fumarylacetoacetate hydrolase family protein [unclassified Sphingomonas]KQX19715.1 2-oxopent-4-enoate hydratase [Sphingomonas sp. Root1294]KQY65916.1 2-oxopent-4-enoate hydratase [Sphingomonas sp. Root50]KRB94882.1 2-oxopent-4-enoate hydratase [Sphingomonas sp. Root720]